MAYIGFIKPNAIGGFPFTLRNEYLLETGYVTYTGTWRIKQDGTFNNCSYYNTDTVNVSNPASDGIFSFQIETTAGVMIGLIVGNVVKSLPFTNISTTLVGTTIGSASRTVSGLYTSPLVNHYSYCQPIATCSSNYDLGDFRGYAHGSIGGGTLDAPGIVIPFGATCAIPAKFSKTCVETVNRPHSSSILRIYKGTTLKAESSVTNLVNVQPTMVVTYNETNSNNTMADVCENDWSASSWHYYAGSWQKDKEVAFGITKQKTTFCANATGTISSPNVSGNITYNCSPTCFQLTIHHNTPSGADIHSITPTGSGMAYSRSVSAGTADGWSMKALYCGVFFTIGNG